MILPALMTLALLADGPAPPPAAETPDPVFAQINALMTAWKGKPGAGLRGRLGLSFGSRPASDGQVIFWRTTVSQGTVCRNDPVGGALRCDRGIEAPCQLAVAFDLEMKVRTWRATGAPAACRQFVDKIGAP